MEVLNSLARGLGDVYKRQALSFPFDCNRKIQFETLPGRKLVLVEMIAIFNILRA